MERAANGETVTATNNDETKGTIISTSSLDSPDRRVRNRIRCAASSANREGIHDVFVIPGIHSAPTTSLAILQLHRIITTLL
jgi:hypothetical protein